MPSDTFLLVTAALAFCVAVSAPTMDAREQDRSEVLAKAAEYVESFARDIAGVVIEERHAQAAVSRDAGRIARVIRSDLSVIADDQFGWIEFRDVFEVDGAPVRDRSERILALFAEPGDDAPALARDIVAEGARFNVAPVGIKFERTLNLPMAALSFLMGRNQSRSRFVGGGQEVVEGRSAVVLRFEETAEPRLIGSPDGAPATGRFWVEPESGRVVQSELRMNSQQGSIAVGARIFIRYAPEPATGLWLPGSMEEDYLFVDVSERVVGSLSGRALYSNARRFGVGVVETVAP